MLRLLLITAYLILGVAQNDLASTHGLKLSLVKMEYEAATATLYLSIRLFTDDLAVAIHQPLSNGLLPEVHDSLVLNYIHEHLKLYVEDKELTAYFFSKVADEEVYELNLVVPDLPDLRQLRIENNILVEVFEKQRNVVKTEGFGKAQTFTFDKAIVVHTIDRTN